MGCWRQRPEHNQALFQIFLFYTFKSTNGDAINTFIDSEMFTYL